MENLNAIIQPIEIKARVYLNTMHEAKIENEADKENAVALLKEITTYKKSIKQQEEELSADAKKTLNDIKATFKQPKQFIEEAEAILRTKINHFLDEQREKWKPKRWR